MFHKIWNEFLLAARKSDSCSSPVVASEVRGPWLLSSAVVCSIWPFHINCVGLLKWHHYLVSLMYISFPFFLQIMTKHFNYEENHKLMDQRLVICTISCLFAVTALVYDFLRPFPESRLVLLICVLSYPLTIICTLNEVFKLLAYGSFYTLWRSSCHMLVPVQFVLLQVVAHWGSIGEWRRGKDRKQPIGLDESTPVSKANKIKRTYLNIMLWGTLVE